MNALRHGHIDFGRSMDLFKKLGLLLVVALLCACNQPRGSRDSCQSCGNSTVDSSILEAKLPSDGTDHASELTDLGALSESPVSGDAVPGAIPPQVLNHVGSLSSEDLKRIESLQKDIDCAVAEQSKRHITCD